MKKTRLVIAIFMLVSVMVLGGCTLFNQIPTNPSTTSKGSVKISVQIPTEFLNDASQQFVSHTIALAELIVKITKGSEVYTQSAAALVSTTELLFNDLSVGTWAVEVNVKDTDGFIVYKGTSSVNVAANTVTTTPVYLAVQQGNLDVTVTFGSDLGITNGQVILVNPASLEEMPIALNISGTTGTANYTMLKATTYRLKVKLFTGAGVVVAEGEVPVDVLPSRTMTANLTVNGSTGDLDILLTWQNIPGAPLGAGAVVAGKYMYISWQMSDSPNIVGYMLYKSTSPLGPKTFLTSNLISGYEYVDTNIVEGETYYYWVQAYNEQGLCSDLTAAEPVLVGDRTKILVEGCINDTDLLIMNADGTNLVNVTGELGLDIEGSLSPDGMYLLYQRYNDANGYSDIYLKHMGSGVIRNLTNTPNFSEYNPSFSPDGSKIVYSGLDGMDLYVMTADGNTYWNMTLSEYFNESSPVFHPNNSTVLFLHQEGDIWQIWTKDISLDNLTQIPTPSNLAVREASWSPDGTKIVYSGSVVDAYGNWTQDAQLWVVNADGTNAIKLFDFRADPCYPSWSPDSQRIVFSCDHDYDYQWDLFVINADGTGLLMLPESTSYISDPRFTPDGTKIYFSGRDMDGTMDIMIVDSWAVGGPINLTPNTPWDLYKPKMTDF